MDSPLFDGYPLPVTHTDGTVWGRARMIAWDDRVLIVVPDEHGLPQVVLDAAADGFRHATRTAPLAGGGEVSAGPQQGCRCGSTLGRYTPAELAGFVPA